jgi:FtsP/CotA-like multicopper oxidase with cupredoxin domain/plastocyanin
VRSEDRGVFTTMATVFSILALSFAFVGMVVAGRAFSDSKTAKDDALAANGTRVALTEFAIEPSSVAVAARGALTVTNSGKVDHDLAIKGTDRKTAMLQPGSTDRLDLKGLKAGSYTMFCEVPGHADSGMKGTLTIGNGADGMAGMDHSGGAMNSAANEAMDEDMAVRTAAFPAATEGLGGQVLAPTVLPDGTLEFELTAKIVKWEVEPGKVVDAWTYNGTVPGPTIKIDVGDRVRIVLINELPESTVIHWHGVEVPNTMDGVPDITQPPVKPGERFAYEFTAVGPAVGMYHSHHHAEKQVPNGLAGAFLIGDMPVPPGVTVSQRHQMVLNDAGTIGLAINGKSFPATAPIVAKLGEWVEINYFNEGLQVHPMHLHGLPQLVIAKDGFPVSDPYEVDTQLVAPGERYTVLVQATDPGTWAFHCHILNHAEGDQGMFGMVTAMVVQ